MRIQIIGRRWRDSNGNTYHTATTTIDGAEWPTTPVTYGYGEHYMETALEQLEQDGTVKVRINSGAEAPWHYLRKTLGHELDYFAHDVPRKKDL